MYITPFKLGEYRRIYGLDPSCNRRYSRPKGKTCRDKSLEEKLEGGLP